MRNEDVDMRNNYYLIGMAQDAPKHPWVFCLEPPFSVPQVESPGWFGVADVGLVGVATVLGKALGLGRCAGARNASGAEDASVRAVRRDLRFLLV